jgi:GxxExxY protein
MSELSDRDLAGQIIGAAITVHRTLGPGFLEAVYEKALSIELDALGIPHESQKTVEVFYRGKPVGEHRIDLYVGGRIVVELKAVKSLDDIFFSTVRSYMKALGTDSGLLLNFAAMPLTIKRVAREWNSAPDDSFLSS